MTPDTYSPPRVVREEGSLVPGQASPPMRSGQEPDPAEVIAEARALVSRHIVGAKHVRIRVVTLRRLLEALDR